MENFRMYESSYRNILEELKDKLYDIDTSEIQDVINRLYELVDTNEDYIDGAISAIEKLCDKNEEFKKEWFGALDEVESEVLEEGKLGKLASIALLALSMGISLTGCDVAPQMPPEITAEAPSDKVSVEEEPIEEEPVVDDKEEETMDTFDSMEDVKDGTVEKKPMYDEVKNKIKWYTKGDRGIRVSMNLDGTLSEPREETYKEVVLTEGERDDMTPVGTKGYSWIPVKVMIDVSSSGKMLYYSIDGGEILPFKTYDPPYTYIR